MIRVFFALAALLGLIWLAVWLGKSSPTQRAQAFKMILLYGAGGFLLLLDGRVFDQPDLVTEVLAALDEGQQVEFEVTQSDKGPQAQDVTAIS